MRLEPVGIYKSPDGRFFVRRDFAGFYHVIEWPSEREVAPLPFERLTNAIKACDKAYRDHAGMP